MATPKVVEVPTLPKRHRNAAIKMMYEPKSPGFGPSIMVRFPAKFSAQQVADFAPLGMVAAELTNAIAHRFRSTGRDAVGRLVGKHNVTGKMWESLKVGVNTRRARVIFSGSSFGSRVRWKWPGGAKPAIPRNDRGQFRAFTDDERAGFKKERVIEVDRRRVANKLKAWKCSDSDGRNILTPSAEEAATVRHSYAVALKEYLEVRNV